MPPQGSVADMSTTSSPRPSYADAARKGQLRASANDANEASPTHSLSHKPSSAVQAWMHPVAAGAELESEKLVHGDVASVSSRLQWLVQHFKNSKIEPTASEVFEQTKADLRRSFIGPMHPEIRRGCNCAQCKPDLYRTLLHCRDRALLYHREGGEIDLPNTVTQVRSHGLRYRRHDAVHIATLAVHSFSKGFNELSKIQKEAAGAWKQWLTSDAAKALCSMDPGRVHEQALQKPAGILSDIFFLGQLPNSVFHVVWDGSLAGGVLARSSLIDLPVNARIREHHNFCRIQPHSACIKLDTKMIVALILHEMCHSFLNRYGCRGEAHSGCNSILCISLGQQNLQAHGRAWQWLSQGIEDHMLEILGFERSLGRISCLVSNQRKVQNGIPCSRFSDCEIRKLCSRGKYEGVLSFILRKNRALGDEVMWDRIYARIEEKWFRTFRHAGGDGKRRCSI